MSQTRINKKELREIVISNPDAVLKVKKKDNIDYHHGFSCGETWKGVYILLESDRVLELPVPIYRYMYGDIGKIFILAYVPMKFWPEKRQKAKERAEALEVKYLNWLDEITYKESAH